MKKKILVILGPTATGKTDLALKLAKKFNGEIISADSRQVYKGLDIGTGKITNSKLSIEKGQGFWEVDGVKIWMYDWEDPKNQYNVSRFVKDAKKDLEKVYKNGRLPILVGGTGLYIKALVDGLDNLSIPTDKKLRKELEKLTKEELQKKLQKINQQRWEGMNYSDKENPRRLVRAIELSLSSPVKVRLPRPLNPVQGPRNDVFKIGLTAPREVLYKNVDLSINSRINQGMIEETKSLFKNGLTLKRMKQLGLEYGILADYLADKIKNKEDLVKILKGKVHGFVRRQLTFLKKEKDINWFDITSEAYIPKVEKLISKWYHHSDATQN